MSLVSLRPQAEDDLAEIWAYIAENSPEQADAFISKIDREFRSLARHPFMGRQRPELLPDLRSFPLGHYVIFYVPSDEGSK